PHQQRHNNGRLAIKAGKVADMDVDHVRRAAHGQADGLKKGAAGDGEFFRPGTVRMGLHERHLEFARKLGSAVVGDHRRYSSTRAVERREMRNTHKTIHQWSPASAWNTVR